jgi:hypothetical protein
MSSIGTTNFTKEELYRMNNDTKYGFNWINLMHVNHINDNSKNIKYKLYPTGNIKDINIGREYIALPEDKVLNCNDKIRYNLL